MVISREESIVGDSGPTDWIRSSTTFLLAVTAVTLF